MEVRSEKLIAVRCVREDSLNRLYHILPEYATAKILTVKHKTPRRLSFLRGVLFVNECQNISTHFNKCGILIVLLTLSGRKEVTFLELLISFFLSVGASVVAYYICKWLDR